MISLSAVSKVYGEGSGRVCALEQVDLSIPRGDIFGIIGYSGAGKSTLIRLLNGLERPSAGQVIVNGTEISAAPERALRQLRPRIGMIFQHFNLLWSRTVRGNIALAMEIAGHPRSAIRARTEELIGLVGLEGRGDHYPAQLSGGQKQRVGIARALANQPEVLLCDEATSALDPETTDQILDLLSGINQRLGLTIVMITHEMHVVRRICSGVAVMDQGRVVESGPVAQILSAPREAITQRFLGEPAALQVAFPASSAADLLALLARSGARLSAVQPEGAGFVADLHSPAESLSGLRDQLSTAGFLRAEG